MNTFDNYFTPNHRCERRNNSRWRGRLCTRSRRFGRITGIAIYALLSTGFIFFYPAVLIGQVPLTLQECIEHGIHNNVDIMRAEEEIHRAGAQLDETRSERLPHLLFRLNYNRLSDIDPFTISVPAGPDVTRIVKVQPVILNNYGIIGQIQQPLYTGNRIGNTIESAQLQQEVSTINSQRQRQKTIHDITVGYWNLAGALRNLEVIRKSILHVESHLRDLESMENEGLVTRHDVLEAQTRLAQVRLAEITVRKIVQVSRTRLSIAIGESTHIEILPTDEPEIISFTKTLEESIHIAYEERADLKASEHTISLNRLRKKIVGASSLPSVHLLGTFDFSRPNRRILPLRNSWEGTWDFGIALQFDAWDWGKGRSQVAQASVDIRTAELAYQKHRDALMLGVTDKYYSVTENQERIIMAESSVMHTEENLRITQSMFQQGMATNTMILNAERDWLQAKTDFAMAQMEYSIAVAGLLFEMGVDKLE